MEAEREGTLLAPAGYALGRLLGYLGAYRRGAVVLAVCLVGSVAFGVAVAWLEGQIVDRALVPRDGGAFVALVGALVAAFLLTALLGLGENALRARLGQAVTRDLRLRLFTRLQALHPADVQRLGSGDLLSRLTHDLAEVEVALNGSLVELLRLVLTLVLALATVLWIDWRLALVPALGLPLLMGVSRWLSAAIARQGAARQEALAAVTGAVHETLAARPLVAAFGLQGRAIADFAGRLERLRRVSLRLDDLGNGFMFAASLVAWSVELLVVAVGGSLVLRGDLTVGAVVTAVALVGQIIGPVQSITGYVHVLQRASAAVRRVEAVLALRPAVAERPGAVDLPPLGAAVRLEGVTFGHDPARPALRDVTLTVPAGAHVALVGPSGSGKSSLIGLLARFADPLAGRVTIDGHDLRDVTLASLRQQIGAVFQESLLLDLPLRENIRLGRPGATDAEVEAAARDAEIHDEIVAMPAGYATLAGEGGGRLSGGQRQRLALARALLRRPRLLLLDEPTSALDLPAEAAVAATLRRLARGRTVVCATHRLPLAAQADLVVVLAEGRVVDQGPPGLVLARLGPPLPGAAATTRAVVAGPHHGQPDAPLASLIRPPAESPLPG